jgi:hypothetical protein
VPIGATSHRRPEEVAKALAVPIRQAGRDITPSALEITVAGTGGYPFMVQLVGLHAWRAESTAGVIDDDQAHRGVDQARRKVGQLVHASALADLSAIDRSFLAAMAHDDAASRMSDIAKRLGVDATYAGQYPLGLIAAQGDRTPRPRPRRLHPPRTPRLPTRARRQQPLGS